MSDVCTVTGEPPKYCTCPTWTMYQRGCRCEAAKQANRDYQRAYHGRTVCPICLAYTSRPSGFCTRHEKEMEGGKR